MLGVDPPARAVLQYLPPFLERMGDRRTDGFCVRHSELVNLLGPGIKRFRQCQQRHDSQPQCDQGELSSSKAQFLCDVAVHRAFSFPVVSTTLGSLPGK